MKYLLFVLGTFFICVTAMAQAQLVIMDGNHAPAFKPTVPWSRQTTSVYVENVGNKAAVLWSNSISFQNQSGDTAYWATSNTCRGILFPGMACNFFIYFQPVKTGILGDVLSVVYYDETDPARRQLKVTWPLSTTVLTPPKLEIAEGPVFDFGVVVPDETKTHTFTVTNSGEYPAVGMSYSVHPGRPFGFLRGQYPGANGTCGDVLNYKESCTIVIEYWPTQPAINKYLFELSYYDGRGGTMTSSSLELRGSSR